MSGSSVGNARVPRFNAESVNPALAPNLGDAFQGFAFELLRRKRPGLRTYPTAGKDGGIDLLEDVTGGRHVFECKHIGEDGDKAALARWRPVAKNLTTHLPERSPKQYAPWWNTERPILSYTFCVSSTLGNPAQDDTLRDTIRSTFVSLGKEHEHLRHLRDVAVHVMHWPDLTAELGDAPDLLFRWFPKSRPLGLVPIESFVQRGPFSSFLDSSNLDYYSRDQHIAAHGIPAGVEVESETAMLERLSQTVGLIITGAGGYGKTRLVNELGWLAHRQGWCVLRVTGSWRSESLERLTELVRQGERVLLLVDYIETQRGFIEMANDLIDLDETYGMQIKYVANCRTSFYPRIAHLPQHDEVPLAPAGGSEWFRDFRHAVVRHILATGDVGVDSRTLQVCRDVPVVAVFLAYLAATERTDDLNELLSKRDFASWVRGRIERSFPKTNAHDVAAMVAQFPMPDEVALRLAPDEVLSTLERDGWIERQPSLDGDKDVLEWVVVHDVLADQLLTSSLAEQGTFAAAAVRDLLAAAVANGTLAPAVASLQRIRDQPEVEAIPFSGIVRDQFALAPQEWATQAQNFFGSSLLEPTDEVTVLETQRELWGEKLQTRAFRQQIGWLARQDQILSSDSAREAVLEWLQRALDIEETDYLLRSAIFLSPATTAARARAWIEAQPTDFATHFVITAWLAAGLPPADVAKSVRAWLEVHGNHLRAWHVLGTWLTAGGEPELVEPFVLSWLKSHPSLRLGGSVVLAQWLKAHGSLDAVNQRVIEWLKVNIGWASSNYVLGNWIDSGADLELARPLVEQWLEQHSQLFEAGYVTAPWLRRGGPLEVVGEGIETWLDLYVGRTEGPMVSSALVRASPKTAETVTSVIGRWAPEPTNVDFGRTLTAWLESGGAPSLVQPQLDEWLAKFGTTREAGQVYLGWLSQADPPAAVREASLRWFVAFPTDLTAGHMSKLFVLDEVIDVDTVRAILRWCIAFPAHEDALWRLTQLKTNLRLEEVSEEVLEACEAVMEVALAEPVLDEIQTTQLTTLCTFIAQARHFQTGIPADRCDAVLVAWLRHPSSFQHGERKVPNTERPKFVRRMLSLLLRGWIDVQADADGLARMLTWVASWETSHVEAARKAIAQVAAIYPEADSIWSIVPPLPKGEGSSVA